MEAFEEREKMLEHRASILEVEFSKLAAHPYTSAQHPDPELERRKYRKVICGDYVCVCKSLIQMYMLTAWLTEKQIIHICPNSSIIAKGPHLLR